jgi:hypothetical protein
MERETIEDPLTNETNRRILFITHRKPLTGPAIAYTLDLPLVDCYRRIAALVRARYLTVAGYSVTPKKKAHKIYRARAEGIEFYFSRDRLKMRVPRRGHGVEAMNIEVVIPPRRRPRG